MTNHILHDVSGGVATITLNRPEVHNAFDEAVIADLTALLEKAGSDDSVRAVVLRGNGKSFCAGGDLNWMRRSADYSYDENVADAMKLGQLLYTLNTLPKPTIALVHGSVFGGGVGLTAACDIAIAAPDTVFCLSEVRIGLIPSVIAPYVIAAMGERQARRYFMTAERFSGERAKEIGFVHETGDVDALCVRIISSLLEGAPRAQARGKKLLMQLVNRPVDAAMVTLTATQIAEARAAEEGKEGLSAFLNKTEPVWRKK